MKEQQLKQFIAAKIYAKQGFSVNWKGAEPEAGYMVSFNEGELIKPTESILFEDVDKWVDENYRKLVDGNLFAGGWVDGDKYYLEISRNIGLETAAKDFARKHKQIAIWDVLKQKQIIINY
jgi:hypothetical protein